MHTRQIERRLQRAGKMRAESQRLREEAAVILAEDVPRAVEAGIAVTRIAELAHLSRRAVYNILARHDA